MDKRTFKICEAVHLGLDYYYMGPHKKTMLTDKDVEMRPEAIHDGYIHVKGKGDKEAKIPICPRLQREIDRYDGEWKFSYTAKVLERIAAKAIPEGFPGKAHAHRFRHSFGSNLIRAGVNIKVVQTLMRHETVNLTLDTYAHILDTDTEKAIREVYS